ncbi:MAG: GNAT family N-acetyltransferase [Armatimonas sp.]
MVIRCWEETDSLEELTELLHRAYARLGAMGLNYTAVDQSVEVTAERVGEGVCFVAVLDNRLVGTIVVTPTNPADSCTYYARPDVAGAQQFAVEPGMQGQGIGRALLQVAEERAQSDGYAYLALDTAEEATHLIEFYQRLGYELVGSVKWQSKVYTSVILSKPLSNSGG